MLELLLLLREGEDTNTEKLLREHIAAHNSKQLTMQTAQLSLSRVQSLKYALQQEQHTLDLMSRIANFSSGGTDKEPRNPERMDAAYQRLKQRLAGISEPSDKTFGNIPDSTVDTLENASRALEVTRRYLEAISDQIASLDNMCDKLIREMPIKPTDSPPDYESLYVRILESEQLGANIHLRIRSSTALTLLG